MILVDPIPGQEDRNVEFLVNNGVAMISSKTYPVSEALNQLLEDTCRREEIKNAIERIAKPYAAKAVGDFIVAQWENRSRLYVSITAGSTTSDTYHRAGRV